MAEQNGGPPAQPPQPQATQPQPPAPTLPPDAAKVEAGPQRPDAAKRADADDAALRQARAAERVLALNVERVRGKRRVVDAAGNGVRCGRARGAR